MAFDTHADSDLGTDISVEIVFSNYRRTNGILVPFEVVQALNGTPLLDMTISSASPNQMLQGR